MTDETPSQRIDRVAAELGLTMTAVFVPWSQSRNKNEKQPSLNWRVTILRNAKPIIETDYMAGSGHCPADKQKDHYRKNKMIAFECENGFAASMMESIDHIMPLRRKPLWPDMRDVLHSLILDSDVIDHPTFESWASDFGYEPDSRTAEATYKACLDIALKLRAGIGDDGIRKLREAGQDY